MKEFTLNQGELNLMVILERIKNGELTQAEAANLLKLCVRQVRRKAKRYVTEGVAGLIHRGAGRPGNRTFSQEKTTAILRLVSEKYMVLKNKAGPTFIAEQLEKNDGIIINHETLRKLMIRHNLWSVADRKKRRHQWRERKHHFGELVQIDGSFHRWFGDEYATLIAFIDDATGKLMVAEFVKQETIKDFACLTHQYLKKYGRPLVLYSDRGKVFKVNKSNGSTASKTQFQRILQELDIDLVHAYSPQAKGRVERLFKTMQDRLVKELELANISTCSAANRYLNNVYIQEHNKKFAVKPIENADFHRSIKGINMLSIFCLKFERIINNNYTVTLKESLFQLKQDKETFIRRGQKVQIHQHFDGTVDIFRLGKKLGFKRVFEQPKVNKKSLPKRPSTKPQRPFVYRRPSLSHPWRYPGNRPDISIVLK